MSSRDLKPALPVSRARGLHHHIIMISFFCYHAMCRGSREFHHLTACWNCLLGATVPAAYWDEVEQMARDQPLCHVCGLSRFVLPQRSPFYERAGVNCTRARALDPGPRGTSDARTGSAAGGSAPEDAHLLGPRLLPSPEHHLPLPSSLLGPPACWTNSVCSLFLAC